MPDSERIDYKGEPKKKYPKARDYSTSVEAEHVPELRNLSPLQKYDILVRTNREAVKLKGLTPKNIVDEVIAKLAIAPQDVKDIPQIPGALKQLLDTVIANPKGVAREMLLNPPGTTDILAATVPGAALQTYRATVPLHARTYLHHLSGIKTPFTRVTSKEKTFLRESAKRSIEARIDDINTIDIPSRKELANKNSIIRGMRSKDAIIEGIEYGLHPYLSKKSRAMLKKFRDNKLNPDEELSLATTMKNKMISLNNRKFKEDMSGSTLHRAESGPRADYEKMGARKKKGFYTNDMLDLIEDFEYPQHIKESNVDVRRALGKHYVEPKMVNGEIVPKAIHDVYKFYPNYYNFDSGSIRNFVKGRAKYMKQAIKNVIDRIAVRKSGIPIQNRIGNALQYIGDEIKDTIYLAKTKEGEFLRKLAFGRPPTRIEIMLDEADQLNAIDKAAALAAASHLASAKRE